MKFNLTKSIKHGEEELMELDLREPTAKDIKKLGFPIDLKGGDLRTSVIHGYICDLAAIPPSVVDQISAKDFLGLVAVITGFFGESQA